MFTILEKKLLAPNIHYALMKAPLIAAKARAGQFVMVRISGTGERVPLTIADFDRAAGTVTLVFQEAGKTTKLFGALKAGDSIPDLLGPQGNPTEIETFGRCVVVGGGIGVAPVYPLARELTAAGNEVISIIGYRSKDHLFWEEKMKSVSKRLVICTNDGSYGMKGFVTDALKQVMAEGGVSVVFAIGPAVMMRAVAEMTRPAGIRTIVSLNALMVCAMGMCGACRVEVAGKTRFTCMDGPDFDAHQVDFGLLMKRLETYKDEECACQTKKV